MARRISRQELKRDEIVDAAVDAGHWLEENWQTAVKWAAGVVVVALVAVGWWVWARHSRNVTEQRLANAVAEFEKLEAEGFEDTAALEDVLAELDSVAQKAGQSTPGLVARLYRGSGLLRIGRPEAATPLLEEVVGRADGSLSLAATAYPLLARAYEKAGRREEAISLLEGLTEQADPKLPLDQALLQLGQLYDSAGRTEEARAQFQRILDEFPTGAAARTAREKLES